MGTLPLKMPRSIRRYAAAGKVDNAAWMLASCSSTKELHVVQRTPKEHGSGCQRPMLRLESFHQRRESECIQ